MRCANLAPGTPEDVYLYPFGDPDHPIVLTHEGYGYGSVSDYMPVSAGQYTVAMRPAGAPAASPPSISVSFMVSAGSNYTVASIGPATARRLEVLQDEMAGAAGSKVLVRVIQASLKQPRVTVSVGSGILASQLAFGAVSAYQAVPPGTPTVTFSTPGGHVAMPVDAGRRFGPHHRRPGRDLRAADRQPDRCGGQPGRAAGRRRHRVRRDGAGRRAGAGAVAGHAGRRAAAGGGRGIRPAPVAGLGRDPARLRLLIRSLGGRAGLATAGNVSGSRYDPGMDWKLELVFVPVTDVDRAKAFYVDQVGFNADYDQQVNDELRFVQLTPPGSACSIAIGTGLVDMAPGSLRNLQIVVDDVAAARKQLVERGVRASDVDVQPWGSFVTFADPDGNTWALQQLPPRQG